MFRSQFGAFLEDWMNCFQDNNGKKLKKFQEKGWEFRKKWGAVI